MSYFLCHNFFGQLPSPLLIQLISGFFHCYLTQSAFFSYVGIFGIFGIPSKRLLAYKLRELVMLACCGGDGSNKWHPPHSATAQAPACWGRSRWRCPPPPSSLTDRPPSRRLAALLRGRPAPPTRREALNQCNTWGSVAHVYTGILLSVLFIGKCIFTACTYIDDYDMQIYTHIDHKTDIHSSSFTQYRYTHIMQITPISLKSMQVNVDTTRKQSSAKDLALFTILACLCALMSGLRGPAAGAGGAEYTVGAAWMMDGVGLFEDGPTGRGGGVGTMGAMLRCCKNKNKSTGET